MSARTSAIETLEPRRLFAAGSLDLAFGGGDGAADVRINAHVAWVPAATDAAVDAAGRVFVAGVYGGQKNQFSVARLTKGGTADATFGRSGIATASLPLGRSGDVDVIADGRGRVLVMISTDRGVTITRLTEAGAPDKKFGKNGTAVVPFVTSAGDLAVDANGSVVVLGATPGKAGARAAVVRLTYRGKLDATFGSGGVYKAPVQGTNYDPAADSIGEALRIAPGGRITCVAHLEFQHYPEYNDDPVGEVAFQLDADGRLRTAFGNSGFLVEEGYEGTGGGTYYSFDAIAPDGGLVLRTDHTNVYNDQGDTSQSGTYAGLDADGQPTDYYGFSYPGDVSRLNLGVVAIQSDGKAIVVDDADVFRLDAEFNRDPTFATNESIARKLAYAPSRLVRDAATLLLVASARGLGVGSVFTVTAVSLA